MAKNRDFPEDFLFGTACAAAQVEGGRVSSSWDRWSQDPSHIKDGTTTRRACDHWNRVDEDIALQKELGLSTHRLGLDWARIEPQEGNFDLGVLAHYRDELIKLRKADIVPLVTLHHFSNPLWLEDAGGWIQTSAVPAFVNFTEKVMETLGDLVSDWITINEPNVYLVMGYQEGAWPPGYKNRTDLYFRAARIMAEAHAQAYKTIHRIRKQKGWPGRTLVGAAHHLRVFDGDSCLVSKLSAFIHEHLFQWIFLEAMISGRLHLPFGFGRPWGNKVLSDFIGINYYTRDTIQGDIFSLPLLGNRVARPGVGRNDLGWEIYPEGLGILCKRLYARYKLPIMITENGTCDEVDAFRTSFLHDHLKVIAACISDGIPITRYYHWTLMDNFEWAEGESARFGLIHLDFVKQKRSIKKSGYYFAQLAKSGRLEN